MHACIPHPRLPFNELVDVDLANSKKILLTSSVLINLPPSSPEGPRYGIEPSLRQAGTRRKQFRSFADYGITMKTLLEGTTVTGGKTKTAFAMEAQVHGRFTTN